METTRTPEDRYMAPSPALLLGHWSTSLASDVLLLALAAAEVVWRPVTAGLVGPAQPDVVGILPPLSQAVERATLLF